MPIPQQVVTSMDDFKKRLADCRARKVNVEVQKNFCWWCGEYSQVLHWKYWHGFCGEDCWKEYRDCRLGRVKRQPIQEGEEEISLYYPM